MVTAELASRVELAVKDMLRSGSLRRVKKRKNLYVDLALFNAQVASIWIKAKDFDSAREYLEDARELLDKSSWLQHDLIYGTHYRWAERAYKNAFIFLDSLDNF